ncbi:MAG TPA: hypothetical protein VKE22_08250 [Haliangiales bacterium]|nr:hypothetical protein [Haliangiales bacterium]
MTAIELKTYTDDETDEILTRALRGKDGRLTKADAITLSGLPAHLVDDSLDRLLKRYKSRLEVTDDGELLYTFDGMVRRDEITLRERLRAVGRWLARAGMWAFKVWITVTLIVYFVVFVVVLLAAMFGGRSDDRDNRGGPDLGWIFWLFWPDWRYGSTYGGYRDAYGRRLPPRDTKGRKKLIQAVYDFVFGPVRPAPDKLADEREVLGFLRAHDGRMTSTDLVAMFGWSYRQAEEESTRLLADYDGDPEVTDDGVIVYAFPKLLKSADAAIVPTTPKMAWERVETRPELTSNKPSTDTLVGGFAVFNLLVSFFAAGWARTRFGLAGPVWDWFFTGFPLLFFTLFLAIPGARALARKVGDKRRDARNRRRQAVKRIIEADGKPLPAEPDVEALALDLEGEPDLGAGGDKVLKFPRPAEERGAAKKVLAGTDVAREKQIGKVIFGGDDAEAEEPKQLKR